jgi:nicotinamidase-related amidase
VELDAHPALLIVDVELGVIPYAGDAGRAVVANAAQLARMFRARSAPVVLTVQHPGGAHGRTDMPMVDAEVPDWFTTLAPELGQQDIDLVIHKSQWSAFTGTTLHDELQQRGITQLIICGIATSMGVESSARIAHELGYNVVIVDDATADPNLAADEHAKRVVFPMISQVRSTTALLEA